MNKKDKERKKLAANRQNGEKELQEKIDKFSYRTDWIMNDLKMFGVA